MAKTVYMVADDVAVEVFEAPDNRWPLCNDSNISVEPVLDDAKRLARRAGGTLYRCEPIPADAEPAPEPRTVKAYVTFDPNQSGCQGFWAHSTEEGARAWSKDPIFEIEMREVPPPKPKRKTGWAIMGGPSGPLYGRGGYGAPLPFAFREKGAADELAEMLGYGAAAIEVYRDTMEPVDGGSDA